MRYLVIHDVGAIQQYVFATSRLREIRGASELIDRLNRKDTRNLVKKHRGELIYVGGGGAAADFVDLATAKAFSEDISALYVQETFSSFSTGIVEDYDESAPRDHTKSFRNALIRAHHQLHRLKASRVRETQILTNPYFKRCQACGVYPAFHYDAYLPEQGGRFVCESCLLKRQQKRTTPVHRLIHRRVGLQHHVAKTRFPYELDEIGGQATPQGYIGVIYADGNRVGERLQRIRSKNSLRGFSKTIDAAARHAIAGVLANHCNIPPSQSGKAMLPALVPLCGGDDLVVEVIPKPS